ncbi:hypothetical protein MmiHf6_14580 [Methanimicrococcus hongohii]|uniref:Uncharacterized protein n=1 Tax=Methanimicrococcus hongohii TaxID=3028295 RepID=A0AA96V0H4_9EURY|nr:hypothetical protein [Methanimicrococcus sp. Hf6]WNY24129.1 hypothetical protein MmiHf6_14580 [Methanimicrococcus sp. Hf6]
MDFDEILLNSVLIIILGVVVSLVIYAIFSEARKDGKRAAARSWKQDLKKIIATPKILVTAILFSALFLIFFIGIPFLPAVIIFYLIVREYYRRRGNRKNGIEHAFEI